LLFIAAENHRRTLGLRNTGAKSCPARRNRAFSRAGNEVAMARGTVQIVVERCKACGFCVEFCPTKVLELSSAFNSKGYHPPHAVNPDKCSGCDLCGMYCPDFAIYGFRTKEVKTEATATAAGAEASPESEEVDSAS
jgi:2-oxoglutarate ferredoxin oxidoreductase subunit delta